MNVFPVDLCNLTLIFRVVPSSLGKIQSNCVSLNVNLIISDLYYFSGRQRLQKKTKKLWGKMREMLEQKLLQKLQNTNNTTLQTKHH